jgi:hypothetical protein
MGGNIAVSPELAFLAGAYMAEGSFEKVNDKPKAVILTLGSREKQYFDRIEECCKKLNYKVTTQLYNGRGVRNVRISSEELATYLLTTCGEYSHKKCMSSELRNWDDESLKNFLGGYISGDGSTRGTGLRITTVSKKLALDIQNTLAKLRIASTVQLFKANGRSIKSNYNDNLYKVRDTYCITTTTRKALTLNKYLAGKFIKGNAEGNAASKCFILGNYMLMTMMMTTSTSMMMTMKKRSPLRKSQQLRKHQ